MDGLDCVAYERANERDLMGEDIDTGKKFRQMLHTCG